MDNGIRKGIFIFPVIPCSIKEFIFTGKKQLSTTSAKIDVKYHPDIHTYRVTCMTPLSPFGSVATTLQATPACVRDAIRQLFLHPPVVLMTRTRLPSFSNQVILVPFVIRKRAGAFMRQKRKKCAVSNALCQESSAFQRIISAVTLTYHIPWTERAMELHSAMKSFQIIG